MGPIYQPNDATLPDKQNRYWRTKANYDEVEQLFFEIKGLDLTKVLADYMQGWQNQAARGFRQRERDRGDNKYPWVSIDPKNDSRASFVVVRHINFIATRLTGPQSISFDYIGRLVRRYCLQHRPRRFAKLSLPIPIPAERDRQAMERFWQQTRESWFAQYREGKKKAPNERLYLAERLLHSSRIVISGARLHDILSYEKGHFSYPHDVGQLLGSIDYFKLCWREFHEAEQEPITTKQAPSITDNSVPIASDEVLLISKYYPELGKNSPTSTLSILAAEWYSDLARSGIRRIKYCTVTPYEEATNKTEFLTCLSILLTEAEKYSHIRGYGWRQHFALNDLTPSNEAQLEASGNETLRAVRHWHTEVSLSPIERFAHRARKIELWQNEQHQLTTLGLDINDWEDVYAPLFLEFQRAIYYADNSLLKAAYAELNLLLPTLHTRWLPRTDEYTGEESNSNSYFYARQLVEYWVYCDFAPLRPTSSTHSQRDPCLFTWLISHINVKQWYVWKALELLARKLDEPAPETPYNFLPRVPIADS